MLLTAAPGDRVRLTGRALAFHRKLSAWGTSGVPFAGTVLTPDEATGVFEWIGNDGGRDAFVRSLASGREGRIYRGMLKRA